MKFRYHVRESNYLDMLLQQLKLRRRRASNLLMCFLFTFGQMGVLLWYTLFRAEDFSSMAWMWLLSVITFAVQAGFQLCLAWRARGLLRQMKSKQQIASDFWQEHKLELKEGRLTLRCGGQRAVFDCRRLIGSAVEGETLIISFHYDSRRQERVIMPLTVFHDHQQREDFLAALQEAAEARRQEEAAAPEETETRREAPSEYEYCLRYEYDLPTYLRDQRQAYRAMYLLPLAWTVPVLLRLGATAFLLYLLFTSDLSRVVEVLIVLACLVLNTQHIVIFTPLTNISLKRGLRPLLALNPQRQVCAYITKNELVIDNQTLPVTVPLADVRGVRQLAHSIVVYLPKSVPLTLPTDQVEAEAAAEIAQYLSARSSLLRKK